MKLLLIQSFRSLLAPPSRFVGYSVSVAEKKREWCVNLSIVMQILSRGWQMVFFFFFWGTLLTPCDKSLGITYKQGFEYR